MSLTRQTSRRTLILTPTDAEVSTNQVYTPRYEFLVDGELTLPVPRVINSLKHTDAAASIYRVDVSVNIGGTSQYQLIVTSYDQAGLNPIQHVNQYITINNDRERISIPVLDAAVPQNRSLECSLFETSVGLPATDMTVTVIMQDFASVGPVQEGHRILNELAVVQAQRPDLQFVGGIVTDDALNNRTVFEVDFTDIQNDITNLENEVDTKTTVLYQTKILSSSVGASGSPLVDLTFNNLVIGKQYRIGGSYRLQGTFGGGGHNTQFIATNGVQRLLLGAVAASGVINNANGGCVNQVFTATATTLTFTCEELQSQGQIEGNGTRERTHITLEELPNHVVTSIWT